MLIKVNSLIYKIKIKVKAKPKIKITLVLILSIFFAPGKIEQKKLVTKQVLVMECHQNLVPP